MANRQQRRAAARRGERVHAEDVAIAYCHPVGEVGARFHNSLLSLQAYDLKGRVVTDGTRTVELGGKGHFAYHLPMSSGANIVTARNTLVRKFLDETDAQWLWFVDADMEFPPDTLDRLLATADPSERPIVGGLCFALKRGEAQELVPTLYGFGEKGTVQYQDYPEGEVLRVAATGAACLLIHRSVLEAIRDAKNEDGGLRFPPPWPWFQETITGTDYGDSVSEDITFCLRAGALGFPVVVDTNVKLGHQKPVVLDEAMFRANVPQQEPPAPTYVVIPVRGGWDDYTAPLIKQLVEQGQYERIFLFDNAAGTPDAVPDEGHGEHNAMCVEVIPAAGMNIHEMWNAGIKRAIAENPRCNIAILNNDIKIGPEFLDGLAAVLRCHPSIAAVCPNYDGRKMAEAFLPVKGICAARYDGTGGFAGFAFMARGEMWAAGGPLFDERLQHWYGDTLFLRELDKANLTYGIVRDATVEHLDGGSVTDRAFAEETARKKARDRVVFEAIVAGLPVPAEDAA